MHERAAFKASRQLLQYNSSLFRQLENFCFASTFHVYALGFSCKFGNTFWRIISNSYLRTSKVISMI